MKYTFTLFCLAALFSLYTYTAYSQVVPSSDTTKPLPVSTAGFDVIIKTNGDIVYGLVREVGQELIKYQRTDIPDGPIYTISRSEVYAISYRNQVKDILNPFRETVTPPAPDTTTVVQDTVAASPPPTPPASYTTPPFNRNSFKHGDVRIGIGFIRSYTGVDDASQYSASGGFPIISIGYDVHYKDQIRLGLQMAFGPHKFSRQEYSAYDSTQSNITLKETIFTLHAYGKYTFADRFSLFRPYILFGIGINTSHINSKYDINFITNNDKVQVNSGNNSINLGISARIGTEYEINNQLRVFGDVGVGASVVSVGIVTRVD